MKHAFLDRHAHLDSPIHRLSPRLKISLTLAMLSFILVLLPLLGSPRYVQGLLLSVVVLTAVALLSKVPLLFLISRTALVLPFSALIILVNFWSGTFQGIDMLLILLKSMLSILSLLLLTSTTPFHEILKQLSRWGWPRLIILILAFMYRYFFLLVGEIEALERGVRMRRSSLGGWQRIRVYANIIGMLFIRSYERAENVYRAMKMRGFTGDLA